MPTRRASGAQRRRRLLRRCRQGAKLLHTCPDWYAVDDDGQARHSKQTDRPTKQTHKPTKQTNKPTKQTNRRGRIRPRRGRRDRARGPCAPDRHGSLPPHGILWCGSPMTRTQARPAFPSANVGRCPRGSHEYSSTLPSAHPPALLRSLRQTSAGGKPRCAVPRYLERPMCTGRGRPGACLCRLSAAHVSLRCELAAAP